MSGLFQAHQSCLDMAFVDTLAGAGARWQEEHSPWVRVIERTRPGCVTELTEETVCSKRWVTQAYAEAFPRMPLGTTTASLGGGGS